MVSLEGIEDAVGGRESEETVDSRRGWGSFRRRWRVGEGWLGWGTGGGKS